MKMKFRFLSLFVIVGVMLCLSAPKMADAGYYNDTDPAYFAYDTYVDATRLWGHVYSANRECFGSNQRVQFYSVMYYRLISTGNGGSNTDYSGRAEGVNSYAETECYPPSKQYEISRINSIHNGYWNDIRKTRNSSDGNW